MAVTDAVKTGGAYASRLVESDYARESLSDAVESLREARRAVVKGKEPPKRSWGKRIVLIAVLGGGLALAVSDDLRRQAMELVGAGQSDPESKEK
jgi:hypothetical protein